MKFSLLLVLLLSIPAFAAKVATVKLVRGQASVVIDGKTVALKLDDWVEEGAVIKTAEKSFVKLIFVDKSSMNVGPSSEMKIEQFNGKEAGVIDVVKGQIRSQVTKDYLQIQDPNKSKLFMKTKNAVMGVRGTDFMITTNGTNTATVLFEGEVVFNSLPEQASQMAVAKLDDIVDRGVKVMPGEFSVVQADLPQPTVPSVMNVQQRDTLEKNVNMETSARGPSNAAQENVKSVVPEGLSGEAVSNSSDNLKSEVVSIVTPGGDPLGGKTDGDSIVSPGGDPTSAVAIVAPGTDPGTKPAPTAGDAAGYVKGDSIKPANGSFVHLESGTIIPPPAGSVLDPNTNSYIPAAGNGTVSADGSYVPPKGVEITSSGEMLVTVATPNGEVKQPVLIPPPVITASGPTMAALGDIFAKNPELINTSAPVAAPVPAPIIAPTTITTIDRAPTGSTTPVETQIQNQATSGTLNIEVIK